MTETIREQILAIRDTGLTNMFDLNMVQRLAPIATTMSWSASSKNTVANMCISS